MFIDYVPLALNYAFAHARIVISGMYTSVYKLEFFVIVFILFLMLKSYKTV